MRKQRLLKAALVLAGLLLAASVLFALFHETDPYRYHTGLGESFSISPDDRHIAFSYFKSGAESVYMAKADGTGLQRVTDKGVSASRPVFAPDGKGMLYLGSTEGVRSVYYQPFRDGPPRRITKDYLQVYDAVFSPDSEAIYFIAHAVADGILPEEITEGADLYRIRRNGSGLVKLSHTNTYLTGNLSVSPDGRSVYYTAYEDTERLYVYDIEKKEEKPAFGDMSDEDMYETALSPDGKRLVFTKVADTKPDGTYEYELFLWDWEQNKTKQLTNEGKAISSPVFSHHSNQLAFLKQSNWPDSPEAYEMAAINLDTGHMKKINLETPQAEKQFHPLEWLEKLITLPFIAGVYGLFFIIWIILFSAQGRKITVPVVTSLVVALAAGLSSFLLSFYDPWIGISLMTWAYSLGAAALIVCLFTFVLWLYRKRKSGKHTY